jgi:hypothetical protein
MTRKEAKEFIESLVNMRSVVDNKIAVKSKGVYPEWKANVTYNVGDRLHFGEQLYEVQQVHTSQEDWTPTVTPALYVAIDEEHEGTIEDPIPAVAGMLYEKGLYYIYNDVIYLCIREDTEGGTVLHFTPDQLVGNYFEIVEQ